MSSKLIYYVYAYLRSKDSKTAKAGTPYYVGMGSKRRAYDRDHTVKLPSETSNIIIIERGLSRIGAAALERRLIRWYGKIVDDTGILRNIADGGEGGAGNYLRKSPSETTKRKISKTLTGRKLPPRSDSHRENIRNALIGKTRHIDENWRENLRKANVGKTPSNAGQKCWNNGVKTGSQTIALATNGYWVW